MIQVTANKTHVLLSSYDTSPDLFVAINATFKMAKCRFDPKTKAWVTRIGIYDDSLKEALEELDLVEENEEALEELRQGNPEQVISTKRIIPNYDLLKFPPLVGKAPYEDFQKIDISKGLNRNRFAYFWGMGTGKTYAASAHIAHQYMEWGDAKKILIMSTSIGVRNVYEEILKFVKDIPKEKITIASKDNREPFKDEFDIVLTSYNTFRLICNHYKKLQGITANKPRKPFLPLEEWGAGGNLMLLLDEPQEIANPQSFQGYYTALHAPSFYYRYLFTGTFADKPEKQYNQFKVLDPYLVHNLSYQEWINEYAEVGTQYSRFAVRSWKKDKLQALNERAMQSYASFRETEDIINLPAHYTKTLGVAMSPLHRKLYEAVVRDDLQELGQASVRKTINRFPYLMLAIDHPELLEKHRHRLSPETLKILDKIKDKDLAKFEVVDEIIDDHKGEKGVLWVEHPVTAFSLAERYKKYNPIVITGDTPDEDRAGLIKEFKTNKKHKLLIANIKVLNTSVTITEATFQVYVELIFAYVPYKQSTMRIYRNGQNETVTTYILVYKGSLDYLRVKNLESKGILIKGLLKKNFLTQEEWAKVFNLDVGMEI